MNINLKMLTGNTGKFLGISNMPPSIATTHLPRQTRSMFGSGGVAGQSKYHRHETPQQLSPLNRAHEIWPTHWMDRLHGVPWQCGMPQDSRSAISFEKICSSAGIGFDAEAEQRKFPGKVRRGEDAWAKRVCDGAWAKIIG